MVTQLQWGGPCTEGEHDLKSELWKKTAYPILARKQRKGRGEAREKYWFQGHGSNDLLSPTGPHSISPIP